MQTPDIVSAVAKLAFPAPLHEDWDTAVTVADATTIGECAVPC